MHVKQMMRYIKVCTITLMQTENRNRLFYTALQVGLQGIELELGQPHVDVTHPYKRICLKDYQKTDGLF